MRLVRSAISGNYPATCATREKWEGDRRKQKNGELLRGRTCACMNLRVFACISHIASTSDPRHLSPSCVCVCVCVCVCACVCVCVCVCVCALHSPLACYILSMACSWHSWYITMRIKKCPRPVWQDKMTGRASQCSMDKVWMMPFLSLYTCIHIYTCLNK